MKPVVKKLILTYVIIVLIKILFAYFINSPTGFWDEYIYSKLARSFYYNYNFNVEQNPSPFYPPLYPIVLSIAYIFTNMKSVYFFMKIINALISTSVIIPAYLLTKEFLEEKQIIPITILITLLPINFSFSYYLISENLFYPLFLFSIYFMYNSLKENSLKNNILVGIFIGLTFLAKNLGLILILIYFASHILNRIILKEKLNIKNLLIGLLFITILISPWLIRNYINFGPTVSGILEETVKDNIESALSSEKHKGYYLFALFNWIIIHITALAISSGMFFFFSSFFAIRNNNDNNFKKFLILSFTSIITFILILANNSLGPQPTNLPKIFSYFTGRPVLRYIDVLIPIIIIIGAIGLKKYYEQPNKKMLKKLILLSLPFFIISSQLTLTPLFPINNLSLTHLGIIKTAINFIIKVPLESEFNPIVYSIMLIIFTTLPFLVFFTNKLDLKKIISIVLVLNIVVLILNFGIDIYKTEVWKNNEQLNLGLWFNENGIKNFNVLFDIRNEGNHLTDKKALFKELKEKQYKAQHLALIGFWMNDNLFFNNINKTEDIDYIISTYKLNFPIVKKTENINVYKIEK